MTLAYKKHCTGCSACADACPKGALAMISDHEGFLYPRVDTRRCVDCGFCARACPILNRPTARQPLAVYAAKAKDTELRMESSSGGIFSLLAQQILAKGGKVYGASFDKTDWSIAHIGVENEEGLAELRGSKYLQSRMKGIHQSVKKDLEADRWVLFSGTPCQIAALRQYLGWDWDKLILVDVICHAAPSPLAWRKYLEERLAKIGPGAIIKRIAFRHKNCGWKRYSLSLRFANDKEYRSVFTEDSFMRAFLAELCNRPSCHDCQFRELRSGSDLTIGDFWGVEKVHPEIDDDRGTSLVLINTAKGSALFEQINSRIDRLAVTFKEAIDGNSALVKSRCPHRNRDRFFESLRENDFDCAVTRMLMEPFTLRVRKLMGKVLRKINLRK